MEKQQEWDTGEGKAKARGQGVEESMCKTAIMKSTNW